MQIYDALDETKGGVSPYMLEKLAVAYFDKTYKTRPAANLGEIFLGFLHYFGEQETGTGIQRILQQMVSNF